MFSVPVHVAVYDLILWYVSDLILWYVSDLLVGVKVPFLNNSTSEWRI